MSFERLHVHGNQTLADALPLGPLAVKRTSSNFGLTYLAPGAGASVGLKQYIAQRVGSTLLVAALIWGPFELGSCSLVNQ